jgi:hypothetical protein
MMVELRDTMLVRTKVYKMGMKPAASLDHYLVEMMVDWTVYLWDYLMEMKMAKC